MAAVRIESEAFADTRYEVLAVVAGLADADHARGKMARLWRQCTLECRHALTEIEVKQVLGEDGVNALRESRLGEPIGDGWVSISGAEGRVEWLEKVRKNGKKGGRNAARESQKPNGSQDKSNSKSSSKSERVSEEELEIVEHVLAKLSERAGVEYRPTNQQHVGWVLARLRDGHTELELRKVVWHQANQWEGTDMAKYLRPSTLFRPTKFAEYLPAAEAAYAAEHEPRARDGPPSQQAQPLVASLADSLRAK